MLQYPASDVSDDLTPIFTFHCLEFLHFGKHIEQILWNVRSIFFLAILRSSMRGRTFRLVDPKRLGGSARYPFENTVRLPLTNPHGVIRGLLTAV